MNMLILYYLIVSQPPQLILLDRRISQENSTWNIVYKIKYCGEEKIELLGPDIDFEYKAWVSNSSCPPHIISKKIAMKINLSEINSAQTTVIANSNDRNRCQERINASFSLNLEENPFKNKIYWIPLKLAPQQEFWCYLKIQHEHFLYGTYDPLLGERDIKIRLGNIYFLDKIPLEQENYSAQPKITLSKIPDERKDTRQFRSTPDSLCLTADVQGFQYFRFDDLPVKYGSELKLSFYYLIAIGTEGSCNVRVMEYQDTPSAWYRLDGGFDEQLIIEGRWKYFEQIFTLGKETTTIAIDFRITGANVGEMWIDDIILEYTEKAPEDQ
ncbi:MAG: hypothetical protein AAB847_01150 [Patescibacteria group bacterium]